MDLSEWIVLFAAVGSFYFGAIEYRERKRYPEFLRRVHAEAYELSREPYSFAVGNMHPITVESDELDMAFRALAEDIISLIDGGWYCTPAKFKGD